MLTIFHPALHPVFEALGYTGGYAFYRYSRTRTGDALTDEHRWVVIASAAVGALFGSRVLGLLEQAPATGWHWQQLLVPGGKTIVGGLLGGWLAVELTKLALRIKSRTGDLFAVPLCLGIAIGRVGCFFAGLADDTYGKPTSLPWGVDFGDGVPRHPTQLYEFVFLIILAALLWRWNARPHREGLIFRAFLAAYLGWRLVIDFLKPQPLAHGMNMIQWACIAGLIVLAIGEAVAGSQSMIDQPPTEKSRKGPLRLIAISAVGAIIGAGLCGALPPALHHGTDDLGRVMLGALFICVASIGIIIGVIWFVTSKGRQEDQK